MNTNEQIYYYLCTISLSQRVIGIIYEKKEDRFHIRQYAMG
ncbi:hypothetical protein GGQ57_004007 [Parabacteroides faecis]|uniref:Uncharacterized protein n=1 Tax=Parabacteroides faecis TaxID=1217282 RepID=A0ABR6KRS5_9BACT|nr:hypothetical protein [Parabacteroides faecis]